jgi:minichromosome maintenance protein 10
VVIGHARDLGICAVRKKDDKPCGAWTDKRMAGAGAGAEGDVCEYHIVHAVTRGRATRAEFGKG